MSRKTRTQKHTGSGNKALAIFIGTACGIAAAPNSYAGPTGGTVTSGQGTISTPTSTSTVIDQASSRLSIDWRSFDVSVNETVRFNQPNSTAVAVNRILDQKPSEIYGRIDANGRVVLINSSGMLFGRTAQVNAGSLLATSLDVVSFDSTTGRLNLAAAGSPGAIINDGSITAATGGSVSLVGGLVANNGLIVADRGSVNLAAGRSATLDFYGGGLLRFEADSVLTQNAGGAAAVSNTGDIYADGGQVLLTANAARTVFDRAVNNEGVIRANRIDDSGGTIRLVGAGGTVVSSGVLDASGIGAGTGGEVQVLGENVGLFGSALVDVSGNNGGGTALIGGDYQGANADVINASRTIVSRDSVIRADALDSGDGGKVIVWSDDATQFYGTVTGRGGATSGNGGFMEASSRGVLDFDGNVNLGAAAGQGGHLLLDPDNITIGGGSAVTGDIDFDDPPVPGTATVTASSIQTFLTNTGSLTLQANDNINVNTSFNAGAAPAGRNLTMQAGENITIANGVTISTSGNVSLRANDSTATGTETGNGSVIFSNATSGVTSTGGAVTLRGASVQLGDVTADGAISVTADTGGISQVVNTTLVGGSIGLVAASSIGTVADLRAGTGVSINVDTNGALTAAVAENDGQIHLNFINGLPTLAAGSIALGNVEAGSATGTVLLRAPGNLNVTTLNGVVALGAGNTASAGLRAGDDLTINTDTDQIFDFAPETLALRGDEISDSDGDRDFTFNVANLTFDSDGNGGDVILRGDIGSLRATVLNSNSLTVNVTDAIDLVDVLATDDLSVTAGSVGNPGDITVGDVQATNNVSLTATNSGGIIDDLDNATVIEAGGSLTMTGTSIGSVAANGDIDTDVASLSLTATAGNVVVREADAVTLTAFQGAGGTLTRLETVNGVLTVNDNVDPTTGSVEIIVNENNNLNIANRIVGRQGGVGDTTIRAGNSLTVGEVVGTNIILESGYNRTGGTLTLDSGSPGIGVVTATNNVSLTSDGAINQVGGTVPSVVGNLLTINAGGNVSLDTNVSSLTANVTGAGSTLAIREQLGGLTVNNAAATSTITLQAEGNLALQTVNAGSGAAAVNLTSNGGTINTIDGTSLVSGSTLTLGGTPTSVNLRTNVATFVGNTVAGPLTVLDIAGGLNVSTTTVTGGNNLNLTAAGAGAGTNLALTNVSATTGAATLQATGAISNTGTLTAAGGLTITGAGSVNLATEVGTLTATGVGGSLTVNEATGPLAVGVTAGGLVSLSTTNGALTGTVTGTGLAITGAQSANVTTNVATLSAANVTNDLTINDQTGDLTVQGVTAGGAVSITANQAILDQDEGTTAGNSISGSSVTLTAGTGIGTVSDAQLTTGAGLSVDVNTTGILTATVLNPGGGEINLNLVGTPAAGSTITLGSNATGRDGNVLLQSGGNLNLQDLAAGSISIGDTNTVGVGYVSGATLRLRDTGSVTDFAPFDLLVRGVNVFQGAGTSRTFNFNAGTLSFIASNPTAGADYVLNTDVDTLNVTIGNNLGLTVNELNAVSLGTIAASSVDIQANGAINDDTNEATAITGTNVTLNSATNAIGSTGLNGAIDVIIGSGGSLTATSFTGDVAIRSTGTNAFEVDIAAGSAVVGDGNISLTAASNLDIAELNAGGDNVNVTTTGSITGSAPGTDVTAGQLTLANASSVDLDTNVDTLSANNIAGNVTIDEASGPLTIGTVTSNTGNVALNVAGGGLTLGTVTASNGTVTLNAGGAITDGPTGASVVGTSLIIANAASVDLDTNVNTLNASGVTGNLSVREQAGALAVTNATATGAVSVSTVSGALTGVTASGAGVTLTAGGAASGITITNVNAGAGNVALAAGANGAITDGAGTSVTGNALTITGAGSVDLGTNVATLAATGINGALAINDANALSVTNAVSNGITLTTNGAGNGLTLGTINAGAGTATLSSGGAISSGANTLTATGGLTIANASSVDLRTDVNTLTVTNNVAGTLSVVEQAGSLNVANASATGAVTLGTVNGALTLGTVSGGGVTLTAGGAGSAMTLGTVNAGTGTATLSAGGAVTDAANGTTSLTAGTATITAASIGVQEITGTPENTLNTAVDTLSATATSGDIVVRDADDISLASINGATGQDVIVVAPGDITVTQITGAGPNGAGRVLLAAGSDILANGAGDHITAGNVELRSGGLDAVGGRVGESGNPLRLSVPETINGGANGTGANVPSVLILSRPSTGDSAVPAQAPQHQVVPVSFDAAEGLLLPGNQPVNNYLTTVFTVRTANTDGSVALDNVNLDLAGDAAVRPDPTAQNSLLDLSNASNAQGEGTLYIDWASFDPNVSLFGTVNPPICLPRDQQEEDDSEAPAAANAASSGCAPTTAQQFDGTFRAPTLELVITSRGIEWKPVRAGLLGKLPLIAQR